MKTRSYLKLGVWAAAGLFGLALVAGSAMYAAEEAKKADEKKADEKKADEAKPATDPKTGEKLVPLQIKLPKAMFEGTPKNIKPAPTLEKYVDKPRKPFLAPEGVVSISLKKPVKSSDMEPIIGDLDLVTDGDKEGTDGSYVELGPGLQWVQIDLKGAFEIYALAVWHYHGEGRVFHDVVIQVADDADFIENVKTIYNNDFDNSSGLGIGKDLEYIEDYRGRLIDAKGVKAKYIRLYSKGNTSNDQNHYIEVEAFGKPAK